ncbi:MAG: site-2 protease family protein [Clostridia bacterium]|nr:site-2 protease family protein [Clostridia bacterium]
MERFTAWLLDFLMTLPVILISLSVHELCHGYAAYRLGDPTAKAMGRLSLNPLRHIDPFGFLALMFFHVGWAKPVSVDSRYFKNPKRDMAITALAGPLSNFLLAFVFTFVYFLLFRLGSTMGWLSSSRVTPFAVLVLMTNMMVQINLGLGVFNLVPIPPLDGSKILYAFLPYHVLYKIAPYERYFHFVLLFLLWAGVLSVPIGFAVDLFYELFMKLAGGIIL